ncbi:PTS sugar transporter subunit IIA [Metabacillus sp. RGM 3146]|uniref:PTS sugar transporter subunit IIA n=1 Tax=Metabacillus sp. RGM 3146 TaxID=3401092 RepID=UPI003B9D463C
MAKILLIGHGSFPEGVKSALSMLIGKTDSIEVLAFSKLDELSLFEKKLEEILNHQTGLLIYADFTGGAPQQIAARKVKELKSHHHSLISGASLHTLLELSLLFLYEKSSEVSAGLDRLIKLEGSNCLLILPDQNE